MMTTKDFVSLADMIRQANKITTMTDGSPVFCEDAIALLAQFCKSNNPRFNRERWFAYIAGTCGPKGGNVK